MTDATNDQPESRSVPIKPLVLNRRLRTIRPIGIDGTNLTRLGLRRISALAGLWGVAFINALIVMPLIAIVANTAYAYDWGIYVQAAQRVHEGGLYLHEPFYEWRYSPVLAWMFGSVSFLGVTGWRVAHLLAALAMPTWPLRLFVLASWPFWDDVLNGNVLVFVTLAAVWAVRGSRVGTYCFLAMTVLMPRPLVLPVVGWLLWKQRWSRLPFLGILIVHTVALLASGWSEEWLRLLLSTAGHEMTSGFNLSPSRWLGLGWLVLGIPIAWWLVLRNWLGLASLVASPYIWPHYLMLFTIDVDRWWERIREMRRPQPTVDLAATFDPSPRQVPPRPGHT